MIALERAGIPVTEYYASEIDKYAIKISEKNYPNIKRLGDVREVKGDDLPEIDLLLAGSPCQGFSFAGKQLAFEDPRSALFFEFVRILRETKPKYFLLENVKMKKEYQNVITDILEVEPIEINSALVSAQNRRRLYWVNVPNIAQPEDKNLVLRDILEGDFYCDTEPATGGVRRLANIGKGGQGNRVFSTNNKATCLSASTGGRSGGSANLVQTRKLFNVNPSSRGQNGNVYDINHKAPCVTTNKGEGSKIYIDDDRFESNKRMLKQFRKLDEKSRALLASMWKGSQSNGMTNVHDSVGYRKLTPIECERLQTVPDNYTEGVSNTQRYKMLGNGWTVDVIAHILKHIPDQ